jgi:hypothetical protein
MLSRKVTNAIRFAMFYYILCALFVTVYFVIVFQNTYNIPRYDDFVVFFKFIGDYIDSSSFGEKWELIFSQHGEHRKLLTRLLALLDYWITGKISLSAMIAIGNVFLLGIGSMFILFIKKNADKGLIALAMILLIFNGQVFDTSTWAMGSLQDIGISFFAMLSIYLSINKSASSKSAFITGLFLSVFTVFSHGNGMCLLPAVLLSLILQKRTKEATWYGIIVGIAVICYFIHWSRNPGAVSGLSLERIPVIMMSFLCFLGGNFWIPSLKILSFSFGLFVCFTYLWAIKSKRYKKNFAWFAMLTFMLLTAAMVALNRPVDEIAPLRYRIHCCLITALTVMFYFENKEDIPLGKYMKWTIIPLILFNVFNTSLYSLKCVKQSEYKKVTAYNWARDKSGLFPDYHFELDTILLKTEEKHIFNMPKLPLQALSSKIEITAQCPANLHSDIVYHIDYTEKDEEYICIKGYAYTERRSMDFTDIILWLCNDTHGVKVYPYAERRYELPLKTSIQENCGFLAVIPIKDLPQGSDRMFIEIKRRFL